MRETAKFYHGVGNEEIRVVVIHPGEYLLPELGEDLGRYAERKMLERKVEVIKGARVASYAISYRTRRKRGTRWTSSRQNSPP